MAKTYRLTNLSIDDVSSVDKGAGEGVRVVLMKRAPAAEVLPVFKSFDEAIAKAADFNEAKNRGAIDQAVWALQSVIGAIFCDDEVKDKGKAIAESVTQFKDYIAGLVPVSKQENAPMPLTAAETTALEKQIADTVATAIGPLGATIAKLEIENAFLKMSPAHQEFAKAFSEEDKKKFAAKTEAEREKDVEAKKAETVSKLDPEIKKRLDQADENAKIVKALQEKDEVATFAKRATSLGLAEADGEILRKAYGGDAAAQVELDKRLKALTEQVKVGKVFDEFGNGGPGKEGQTAYDEIVAKAEELRKTDAGAKLTPAQARVAVMENPANADLMKRHNTEKVQKLNRAA